jgi:hypothetical protein
MLTPQLRSQFVTKILTSQTGEKFRVVFLVALVNGKMQAQVVSAECLTKSVSNEAILSLPVNFSKEFVTFTYTQTSDPKVSVFNSLFFFNSQPTRAPSFSN